jgi:hypothetical protein
MTSLFDARCESGACAIHAHDWWNAVISDLKHPVRLATFLCVALLSVAAVRPARADVYGKLMNWRTAEHRYPTFGGNYYTTYDIYIGVQQVHGGPLLFAIFGDADPQILRDLSDNANQCLSITRDDDDTYGIETANPCGRPTCAISPNGMRTCEGVSRGIFGDLSLKWREYPYSRAMCETMKLCN